MFWILSFYPTTVLHVFCFRHIGARFSVLPSVKLTKIPSLGSLQYTDYTDGRRAGGNRVGH